MIGKTMNKPFICWISMSLMMMGILALFPISFKEWAFESAVAVVLLAFILGTMDVEKPKP